MSIISPAITHIFFILETRIKYNFYIGWSIARLSKFCAAASDVRAMDSNSKFFFRINSKFCWPRHHARPWAWKWNGPREWWAESIHTTHGRWSFSKFVFLLKKSTFLLLFSNLHTYVYVLYTCWTCSVCILPYRSALSYVVYGPAKKTTLFRL
jgi:hypothetical protein